jgi:hypothetical protein
VSEPDGPEADTDPPVAGVPGLGPVPAQTDPPAEPDADDDGPRPNLAADHPAIQEVDGEPETASGG